MVALDCHTLAQQYLQVTENDVDTMFGAHYRIEKGEQQLWRDHQAPYEWREYGQYFYYVGVEHSWRTVYDIGEVEAVQHWDFDELADYVVVNEVLAYKIYFLVIFAIIN